MEGFERNFYYIEMSVYRQMLKSGLSDVLVRPDPAKVRGNIFVWSVRSPRTPLDLPTFNLNYEKTSFCEKLDFQAVFGPIGPVFGRIVVTRKRLGCREEDVSFRQCPTGRALRSFTLPAPEAAADAQ